VREKRRGTQVETEGGEVTKTDPESHRLKEAQQLHVSDAIG